MFFIEVGSPGRQSDFLKLYMFEHDDSALKMLNLHHTNHLNRNWVGSCINSSDP